MEWKENGIQAGIFQGLDIPYRSYILLDLKKFLASSLSQIYDEYVYNLKN